MTDLCPAGLAVADSANPQSWNGYSYALNNPATNTDPSGLDCAYLTPGGTTIKQGGISQLQSQQECSNSGGYWVPGTLTDFSLGANGNYVLSSVTQGSGGELAEHTTQYAPTPDAISPEVDPIMLLLGGVEGEAEGAAEEGASAVERVLGVGGGEASGVVEGGASTAAGVAPDPNKLIHIFGNPGHNLSALVQAYGSKEAAYDALVRATQEAVTTKGLTGIFKATVQVGADTITVEGRVIDGVTRIGTAYKP